MKTFVNTNKIKKNIFKKNLLFLFLGVFYIFSFASEEHTSNKEIGAHAEKHEFNAGEMILNHISDAHDWHIMDIGDHAVSLPLPCILYNKSTKSWDIFMSSKFHHGLNNVGVYSYHHGKITTTDGSEFYDFSITKNVASMFIAVILMLVIFIYTAKLFTKNRNKAPSGIQSFIEPLILFLRDEVAKPAIGEAKFLRFMPLLLTIFFFVFINNLLGLVPFFPGGANVTGNIAVTMVLALIVFGIMIFNSNKDFWIHIFNTPGVPWWLKFPIPLMPIIEFIGLISKPLVLCLRLFANITAGHIVILGFFSLIFIFGNMHQAAGYGVSVLSVGLALFMSFLELLVAFLQAYVFTLLASLYIGSAVEEHHHEHETKH